MRKLKMRVFKKKKRNLTISGNACVCHWHVFPNMQNWESAVLQCDHLCVSVSQFWLKRSMFHWVGCLTETMGRFRVGNGFRNFDHHFRMAIRRFRTAGIATWLKKLHLPIFGFCILARLHLYLFVDGIVDVCRRSPGFHWKNVFQMLGNSSGCHSASYHRDSRGRYSLWWVGHSKSFGTAGGVTYQEEVWDYTAGGDTEIDEEDEEHWLDVCRPLVRWFQFVK